MLILSITVFFVIAVSALCSMIEAAIYAVPWTAIENLRKSGSKRGQALFELRSNIDKPITAVLTLNTIANTAGAALAGALAANVFGSHLMAYFAALLTLLILILGEIIPKTLGVVYANPIATFFAVPLKFVVVLFAPVIWLGGLVIRMITPHHNSSPQATEEDINAITSISYRSGKINEYEEKAIRHILALDKKKVSDVLTPRTVVFSLSKELTVGEAYHNLKIWQFSRIPIYDENNEDIIGIVLRREIGKQIASGQPDTRLEDIMHPVRFVLESQSLDKVLTEFLESRQHLFVVLDEYGGLAGVISLEDVLEEMLGHEIVDETDTVTDLRELARLKIGKRLKQRENKDEEK